jgi:hypothetical protein
MQAAAFNAMQGGNSDGSTNYDYNYMEETGMAYLRDGRECTFCSKYDDYLTYVDNSDIMEFFHCQDIDWLYVEACRGANARA